MLKYYLGAPPIKLKSIGLYLLLVSSCNFLSLTNCNLAYSSVELNANTALYPSTALLYKEFKLVKFPNDMGILAISSSIYFTYNS